jgi:hypothetical protein
MFRNYRGCPDFKDKLINFIPKTPKRILKIFIKKNEEKRK